jgi:hypothetical protein
MTHVSLFSQFLVGQTAAERAFSFFDKQFSVGATLFLTELIIRRSCGCNT